MTIPATLPVWAENTNYSQGPDTGNPTKVDPGSVADGHIAGAMFKPSAQNENHRNNLTGQWVNYLDNNDRAVVYFPQTQALIDPQLHILSVFETESGGFTFGTGSYLRHIHVPSPGTYRVNVRCKLGSNSVNQHTHHIYITNTIVASAVMFEASNFPTGGLTKGLVASYEAVIVIADVATEAIGIGPRGANTTSSTVLNDNYDRLTIERIGA